MAEKKSRIRLVLDWDGTLTKKDTLHLVAAIGYERNRDANLTSWDDIVQAYIWDYTQHKENYRSTVDQRNPVGKALRRETEWLASLKPVETRSIERVQAAGIFRGVTSLDVELAGRAAVEEEKLQLRPGWRELLMHQQEAVTTPVVSILSVNWSATFIRSCIEAAFADEPALGTEPTPAASIPVHANEIPLIEGTVYPWICTSTDKLEKLRAVRGNKHREVLVYVGDSATDFNCLIEADVGICVRDDPIGSSQQDLKEILDRLGHETLRLSSEEFRKVEIRISDPAKGGKGKRILWWVQDLDEITKFIGEIKRGEIPSS